MGSGQRNRWVPGSSGKQTGRRLGDRLGSVRPRRVSQPCPSLLPATALFTLVPQCFGVLAGQQDRTVIPCNRAAFLRFQKPVVFW